MRNFEYKNRIAWVLEMAKNKALPQSTLAAKKLKCSSRSIKKYLAQLRAAGYNIRYDRKIERYVLERSKE